MSGIVATVKSGFAASRRYLTSGRRFVAASRSGSRAPWIARTGSARRRASRVSSLRRLLYARRAFLMRPLVHHQLGDVARAVTDELDDDVDVAVEEASLGLGQEWQRGAALRLRGETSVRDSEGHRLADGGLLEAGVPLEH